MNICNTGVTDWRCDLPLLVGQGPSRTGVGKAPFSGVGSSARRLASLYQDCVPGWPDAVNLLERWHGKSGKGDLFPISRARRAAARLLVEMPHLIFLLMGRNVAAAFGVRSLPYFNVNCCAGKLIVVFPHPSGINQWWNDPANRERAGSYLRALCKFGCRYG